MANNDDALYNKHKHTSIWNGKYIFHCDIAMESSGPDNIMTMEEAD